jgi:hypothetical protein
LLEELPWRRTGLGATEMRMLDFISGSERKTARDVLSYETHDSGRVIGYWEQGALLDGLARCRKPTISGIKDGPFTLELHEGKRRERYMKSKVALTPLGYAVLAQTDDFARHNTVRRWWGGTKLTNKRLWRWDQDNKVLIAP